MTIFDNVFYKYELLKVEVWKSIWQDFKPSLPSNEIKIKISKSGNDTIGNKHRTLYNLYASKDERLRKHIAYVLRNRLITSIDQFQIPTVKICRLTAVVLFINLLRNFLCKELTLLKSSFCVNIHQRNVSILHLKTSYDQAGGLLLLRYYKLVSKSLYEILLFGTVHASISIHKNDKDMKQNF